MITEDEPIDGIAVRHNNREYIFNYTTDETTVELVFVRTLFHHTEDVSDDYTIVEDVPDEVQTQLSENKYTLTNVST